LTTPPLLVSLLGFFFVGYGLFTIEEDHTVYDIVRHTFTSLFLYESPLPARPYVLRPGLEQQVTHCALFIGTLYLFLRPFGGAALPRSLLSQQAALGESRLGRHNIKIFTLSS